MSLFIAHTFILFYKMSGRPGILHVQNFPFRKDYTEQLHFDVIKGDALPKDISIGSVSEVWYGWEEGEMKVCCSCMMTCGS